MSTPRFAGQHALVTGGGTGIGRAIALALAREGAKVHVVGLEAAPLAEVAGQFPAAIRSTTLDLGHTARWRELVSREAALDILVNNAAVSVATELDNADDTSLAQVMAVNFGAAWTGCREAAPLMAARGGGRIVNLTSVHGRLAERGSSAYAVAKAALDQLTRSLAVEWADRGILVNAVAPGFVDTPMSRVTGVNELETPYFRQHYVETGRIPMRRAAQPAEIAEPVLFLASRQNTYVTGQVLTVDGGLSLTL